MKLDRECVRHLLLAVESLKPKENVNSGNFMDFEGMGEFDLPAVTYTAERLEEAGFVDIRFIRALGGRNSFVINALTWDGHQFLDNIRDDGIWKETKNITSKVGSASLTILTEVAASVVKKALGLN